MRDNCFLRVGRVVSFIFRLALPFTVTAYRNGELVSEGNLNVDAEVSSYPNEVAETVQKLAEANEKETRLTNMLVKSLNKLEEVSRISVANEHGAASLLQSEVDDILSVSEIETVDRCHQCVRSGGSFFWFGSQCRQSQLNADDAPYAIAGPTDCNRKEAIARIASKRHVREASDCTSGDDPWACVSLAIRHSLFAILSPETPSGNFDNAVFVESEKNRDDFLGEGPANAAFTGGRGIAVSLLATGEKESALPDLRGFWHGQSDGDTGATGRLLEISQRGRRVTLRGKMFPMNVVPAEILPDSAAGGSVLMFLGDAGNLGSRAFLANNQLTFEGGSIFRPRRILAGGSFIQTPFFNTSEMKGRILPCSVWQRMTSETPDHPQSFDSNKCMAAAIQSKRFEELRTQVLDDYSASLLSGPLRPLDKDESPFFASTADGKYVLDKFDLPEGGSQKLLQMVGDGSLARYLRENPKSLLQGPLAAVAIRLPAQFAGEKFREFGALLLENPAPHAISRYFLRPDDAGSWTTKYEDMVGDFRVGSASQRDSLKLLLDQFERDGKFLESRDEGLKPQASYSSLLALGVSEEDCTGAPTCIHVRNDDGDMRAVLGIVKYWEDPQNIKDTSRSLLEQKTSNGEFVVAARHMIDNVFSDVSESLGQSSANDNTMREETDDEFPYKDALDIMIEDCPQKSEKDKKTLATKAKEKATKSAKTQTKKVVNKAKDLVSKKTKNGEEEEETDDEEGEPDAIKEKHDLKWCMGSGWSRIAIDEMKQSVKYGFVKKKTDEYEWHTKDKKLYFFLYKRKQLEDVKKRFQNMEGQNELVQQVVAYSIIKKDVVAGRPLFVMAYGPTYYFTSPKEVQDVQQGVENKDTEHWCGTPQITGLTCNSGELEIADKGLQNVGNVEIQAPRPLCQGLKGRLRNAADTLHSEAGINSFSLYVTVLKPDHKKWQSGGEKIGVPDCTGNEHQVVCMEISYRKIAPTSPDEKKGSKAASEGGAVDGEASNSKDVEKKKTDEDEVTGEDEKSDEQKTPEEIETEVRAKVKKEEAAAEIWREFEPFRYVVLIWRWWEVTKSDDKELLKEQKAGWDNAIDDICKVQPGAEADDATMAENKTPVSTDATKTTDNMLMYILIGAGVLFGLLLLGFGGYCLLGGDKARKGVKKQYRDAEVYYEGDGPEHNRGVPG